MDNAPEQAVNAGAEPPAPASVTAPDPVAPPAPTEPPAAAQAPATEIPAPNPAPAPSPAPTAVQAAPAQPEGRRRGWFGRGARAGVIAAVVVIVAGAFFTIGWFTSTRGDDRDQVVKARQQMGMMIVPQGQSGAQQNVPQGQVLPQSK